MGGTCSANILRITYNFLVKSIDVSDEVRSIGGGGVFMEKVCRSSK